MKRDLVAARAHIEARLHREGHALLQHPGLATGPIAAGVVNVHAQPVAGPMHEELPVVVHGERVFRSARQQAQLHQTFGQHSGSGVVYLAEAPSRSTFRQRRPLRGEHDLVHRPLRAGEGAIHREGAGDVRGEVAVLGACVDEQQITGRELPVVAGVVEDAGVGP